MILLTISAVIILIIMITNYLIKQIDKNEGFSPILIKRRRGRLVTTTTKSLSNLAAPIINKKTKVKLT